eukprot:TRINITY_DN2976_c0_g1_i4.p1 TRINITY_DN2976_c0_g1~~TRINITY_DN2976_c0_g1_i4.p1  ORF type:complete len:1041 (+),score=258.29 TRINITY_DN2976_c0_g1_i4:2-3124(+)
MADQSLAKLRSPDVFVQAEAAGDIFDQWFAAAAAFAKQESTVDAVVAATVQAMRGLIVSGLPGYILNPNLDDSVHRALLGNLRKILSLFLAKPKFSVLLGPPHSQKALQPLVSVLSAEVAPVLQTGASSPLPPAHRVEFLRCLLSLAEWGVFLASNTPGAPFPFALSSDALAAIVCSPADDLLRISASEVVVVLARNVFQQRERAVRLLSQNAPDALAFAVFWRCYGAADATALGLLTARLGVAAKTRNGALLDDFLNSVLTASAELQSAGDAAGMSVDGLLPMLTICDEHRKAEVLDADYGSLERSALLLRVLSQLLTANPAHSGLLQFVLRSPLTRESLALVESSAAAFPESVWVEALLPFLHERVQRMQLQGVSGSVLEQDVIDLVRECCRVHYLNYDRSPSPVLASSLFSLVLEAIRRGYIETERFPSIAATMCKFHFSANPALVCSWVQHAFASSVCHNHRTFRAISDMALNVLNLSNTSLTEAPLSSAAAESQMEETLLLAIIRAPSSSSLLFLSELCVNHPAVLADKERLGVECVVCVQSAMDLMIQSRTTDTVFVSAAFGFLSAFSFVCPPATAPLLFDVFLKVCACTTGTFDTALSDECLCRILDKVREGSTLSTSAVTYALQHCGEDTRCAIASLCPALCVTDRSPGVAMRALLCLLRNNGDTKQETSDTQQYTQHILNACPLRPTADMAVGCAQLVTCLAISQKNSFAPAMSRLCGAAMCSLTNSPQNKIDKEIVLCMDTVAIKADKSTMVTWMISKEGCESLPLLTSQSRQWQCVTEQLLSRQILKVVEKTTDLGVKIIFSPGNVQISSVGVAAAALLRDTDFAVEMRAQANMKNWMSALECAHFFSLADLHTYTSSIRSYVIETIFPNLAKTERWPVPTEQLAPPADPTEYNQMITRMLHAQALFATEGDDSIQLTQRIRNLALTLVSPFFDVGDFAGARNWVRNHHIRDAELFHILDRAQAQARVVGATRAMSGARNLAGRLLDAVLPSRSRDYEMLPLGEVSPQTAQVTVAPVSADTWRSLMNRK